jgi:hypothetical protein
MVFPSRLLSRRLGRDTLLRAILSNATADGKRRRDIGVSLTEKAALSARKWL